MDTEVTLDNIKNNYLVADDILKIFVFARLVAVLNVLEVIIIKLKLGNKCD